MRRLGGLRIFFKFFCIFGGVGGGASPSPNARGSGLGPIAHLSFSYSGISKSGGNVHKKRDGYVEPKNVDKFGKSFNELNRRDFVFNTLLLWYK